MKTKKKNIEMLLVIFIITSSVMAQPAPPAPAEGEPIVGIMGGMGVFVLAAMFVAVRNKLLK